jgi:hypothetical protein
MSAIDPSSRRSDLFQAGGRLAAAMGGGIVSGVVIGGIGGRLAMFVLRLTSDPSVHGIKTDDGFVIGRFTGDTIFLVIFTALLGAVTALLYLVIRLWLPKSWRWLVMTLLGAVIGGALFIRPGGPDFTVLEPLRLAVAIFIALPALHGLTMSVLVESFLSHAPRRFIATFLALLLSLAPLLLLGVPGLFVILLLVTGLVLNRRIRVSDHWDAQPLAWIGRSVILAGGAFALVTLVDDVTEVL